MEGPVVDDSDGGAEVGFDVVGVGCEAGGHGAGGAALDHLDHLGAYDAVIGAGAAHLVPDVGACPASVSGGRAQAGNDLNVYWTTR